MELKKITEKKTKNTILFKLSNFKINTISMLYKIKLNRADRSPVSVTRKMDKNKIPKIL